MSQYDWERGQVDRMKDYDELKEKYSVISAEKLELRKDYEGACKTVANMHAAVTDGTGSENIVVKDVEDLRLERDRLKKLLETLREDYEDVCKTMVEMLAAATGEVGGTFRRGFVEDVEGLRKEYVRMKTALENIPKHRAPDLCGACNVKDEIAAKALE